MCWVFPLQWHWRWGIFIRLYKLKSAFILNLELAFVPQEVGVIGENAIVCCTRDRNDKASVHVVNKLQLQTKTHWLGEFPCQVHFKLLPRNPNVRSFWEMHLDVYSSHIVDELMFEVAILIPIVDDLEGGKCLNSQRNNGHDHFSFVEENVW